LLGLSAFAQEAILPPQGESQQKIQVDSQSIDRFAKAVVKVEDLQKELQAKMESKNAQQLSQEEAQAAQQEFQAKAEKVIEKEGISLEEYSQYVLLAQQDKNFRDKVIN